MSLKTHHASTLVCALALLGGCAAQRGVLAEPVPGDTPVRADTSASHCPGGTIRAPADAARYSSCEVIVGDLTIQDTSLVSLSQLNGLRVVRGKLTIANNPRLATVWGLERLESVQSLSVTDNPRLRDLVGLDGLRAVNELVLNHDGMFSVHGLEGLARVGRLEVTNNPRLISLGALNSVVYADDVLIEDNPRLAAQPGLLRSLVKAEDPIVVKGNAGLSSRDVSNLRAKGAEP